MHPCVQVSIASTLKPKPTLCQTGRAPPATRLLPSQETTRLSLTSRRALSRTHTCLTARSAALTRRMGQQRSRPLRQQARATTRPSATASIVLGVDIGGSGIKGALVDVTTGKLVTERHRIPTPKGATPKDVCDTVAELAKHFDWTGPIGCGFPAAVVGGVVMTAANIDNSWIGENAEQRIAKATGSSQVKVVNDADAAGAAEMLFGAGKNVRGTVLMCTFGTGIGTAIFVDGKLVPNTELGHIWLENGKEGEAFAADSARTREDLSFKKWAGRVDKYLSTMAALFWPTLIIVGGGVSKKSDKWLPLLTLTTPVVPAAGRNEAGIVGAAACVGSERPLAATTA